MNDLKVKPGDTVWCRTFSGEWWQTTARSEPRYDRARALGRCYLTVAVGPYGPLEWVNWPAEDVSTTEPGGMSETERLVAGYERNLNFIRDAVAVRRPFREDWPDTLTDVITELDRIVQRNAHPDDVMRSRLAVGDLVGLWLGVDEADALYLGVAAA